VNKNRVEAQNKDGEMLKQDRVSHGSLTAKFKGWPTSHTAK